jgi:hypothetical protein
MLIADPPHGRTKSSAGACAGGRSARSSSGWTIKRSPVRIANAASLCNIAERPPAQSRTFMMIEVPCAQPLSVRERLALKVYASRSAT